MADIQTLIDMGFSKERAQRALEVTNHKGVEPAMEWLLVHANEDIPLTSENENVPAVAVSEETTPSTDISEPMKNDDSMSNTTSEQTAQSEAKSIRCDECNKLFKNQMEVEFHAAKSGHSSFSESTEEKKPLSEEEKKAQLVLIEEKLKQKRAEREEKERLDALDREKQRIRSGKDMTEAKKRMEEMEMAKIIEQRKREKADEKAARERVKAQIEADKAARKARLAAETGKPQPMPPVQSPATSSTTSTALQANKPQKDYTNTRIQIRLQDGSTITETFSVKEQLSAVRVFIQMKQGTELSFGLMTSFPRKIFSEDDYEKPLEVLGLVPSAVIIVTKSA